jgi:type IV fimbrial biogenesis protein FimT
MYRGFTLIELVALLAVAAVAVSIAVPSYQALIDNHRIQIATHAIVAHLQLARTEAVKSGERVALCPSNEAERCLDGFDWSAGFIVFRDLNHDHDRQSAEPLLRVHGGNRGLRVITSTGRRRVVYEPDGSVTGGSNATFRVCSESTPERNRAVIVSNTGRPRTDRRDAQNRPVECG